MVAHLVLIELRGGYRESPKNKQGCLPPGGPWAYRGLGVITPGVITPGWQRGQRAPRTRTGIHTLRTGAGTRAKHRQ